MSKVEEIIEQLKSLTLLEAADLVKQIEETFDVSAAAPVGGGMMMMAPGAGGGEVVERLLGINLRRILDPTKAGLMVCVGCGEVR